MKTSRNRRRRLAALVVALTGLFAANLNSHASEETGPPVFSAPIKLERSDGGTEPRLAVGPDGRRWVVTNRSERAVVYGSDDGLTWTRTKTEIAGQRMPTIDVDIVATRTGRLIATELDFAGVDLRVSWSDDGGETWTLSLGATLVDQDRQWLAVGPDDPLTGLPRVYLIWHNLATGFASHNMWVQTSIDNGATFGAPAPITLPGDQAFLDLQCANSGGPDEFVVNPDTGRLYALWGARAAPVGGGCVASIESPQFNIIASNRLWLATSPDGSPGSWETTLVVDRSETNQVVTMQQADLSIDRAGNVYVLYPEAPNPYPDFRGSALLYKWAPPGLEQWSEPRAVQPAGGLGNVLPNISAGDPGMLNIVWYAGDESTGKNYWYTTFAQVAGALSDTPVVEVQRIANFPAYEGTAAELMGTCDAGPGGGIKSGLLCSRATDVWGTTLDQNCNLIAAWTAVTNGGGGRAGTYISTQTGGRKVC